MVTAKRVAVDLAFDSGPANDVWIRAAGSLRFYMFVPYQPNVLSLSRHVPSLSGSATRSVAQNEARKRRVNERHVVGCCEELGSAGRTSTSQIDYLWDVYASEYGVCRYLENHVCANGVDFSALSNTER